MFKSECIVDNDLLERLKHRTAEYIDEYGDDTLYTDLMMTPIIKRIHELSGITTVYTCQGHPEKQDYDFCILLAVSETGYDALCNFVAQLRRINLRHPDRIHHLTIQLWSGLDPAYREGVPEQYYNAIIINRQVCDVDDIIETQALILDALNFDQP